ncbi:polyphosphate kinase 2 [Thioalbus denitrificans]|uniref:ADP/GDP-polyphosphate phosphotransferase n=1 Tax=Thioalbus denitrificans TaxID=547122 RepID=A0A369CEL3_9GAMM|nr:polyphosphate kinase 2 [Thioalbus denitrificans]RCX30254.1 polyphosphate kinase 2 [Thioalbus denitrificans]
MATKTRPGAGRTAAAKPAAKRTTAKRTAAKRAPEQAGALAEGRRPEEGNSPEERLRRLSEENRALKAALRRSARKLRAEEILKPYQAELIRLQEHLEQTKTRMIILFEGRDAAGKGGTIRRVTRYMNEKHYRVVALGRPTEEQRTQWFFQKYVTAFPRGGEMVLFDRSWYNRAMVEPVFGFCTDREYQDFMRGVVGFERDLVRQGTVLVKLYFSVTREEQARRFQRRKDDPLRQWKLSEVDLQAQDRWDEFTNMKYEMLKRTNSTHAPWTIIRSDDKVKARLNAIKAILNTVPYERRDPGLDFVPAAEVVVSGARELELMEAQRLQSGKFII